MFDIVKWFFADFSQKRPRWWLQSSPRALFESEDDLNIRFLFDLEVLNDLHVDLMREVAVHGEEKLAFCIIPDVITDFVCGDIAIDYIFCDVYSEVLPIIIGIPNVY